MSSELTTGGEQGAPGSRPGPGADPELRREPAQPPVQGPPGRPPHPHPPHPAYGPPYRPVPPTYAQQYQAAFSPPRPRIPLPAAPVWLPLALLGVGAVAATLATFDRPGLGLVITGLVAGLTAMAALMARPSVADGGGADADDRDRDTAREAPATDPADPAEVAPAERAQAAEATDTATSGPTTGTAATDTDDAEATDAREADAEVSATESTPAADAEETDPADRADSGASAPPSSGSADADSADADSGAGDAPATAPAAPGDAGPPAPGDTGAPEGEPARDAPHPQAPPPAPGAAAPEADSPSAVATAAPRPDRYASAWSAVYGLLAAALLLTAALRDAGWLLFWTLTASFFLASLAFASRNPSFREGAVGVVAGAFSLFRNLPSTPRFLTRPLRNGRGRRLAGPVLVTTAVTAGLLLVFGLLFAFADAVFASYLDRLFDSAFSGPTFFEGFTRTFAMLVTVLFTGSAVLAARRRHAPRRSASPARAPGIPAAPLPTPASPAALPAASPAAGTPVWMWTIPLGALIALFTVFLGVQAVALFGGEEYVQRVAGVTYAEYARQGFFQLVAVSLLVLCVIAVAVRVLPSRPVSTRTLRNTLLGLLCVLTLVILASAMARLQLYIDVYGLTRLRISAEAWIAWSAGVFGLVVVAGVLNTLGRSAAWLPRAAVALAGVALAVFAYANPDLRIAESHHDVELTRIDVAYLSGLSADALPALVELEGEERTCALFRFTYRLDDPYGRGFASWNLSRYQGRAQFLELGLFDQIGEAEQEQCWEQHWRSD